MINLLKFQILACAMGLLFAPTLWAEQVKIMLSNGETTFVELVSISERGIMWTGIDSEIPPRMMGYDKISHIEFPTPDGWQQANYEFERGNYPKAIPIFLGIANNKSAHYHPAPGNYSSLALLRIIDCFREVGQAEKIVALSEKLDVTTLPPAIQPQLELVACWTALGKGDWEDALTKVRAISASPLETGAVDRGYIKGVALENLGETEEAIMAYAEVYTMEFGSRGDLPLKALQKATDLLENLRNENRSEELRALVHTYAHVFNQGSLWEEAGPQAQKLLTKPLKIGAPPEIKSASKNKADIITLKLRERKLVKSGKQTDIVFKPFLPPTPAKAITGKQLIPTTTINGITAAGISLTIETAKSFGLTFQAANGLGVYTRKKTREDAAIDKEGESLTFSMAGVEAFRVAAITFGGGSTSYNWSKGDKVKLIVTGLQEEELAYPNMLASPDEPAGFKRVSVSGGFISAKEGNLKIVHQAGAFGIDAIDLELKMKDTK